MRSLVLNLLLIGLASTASGEEPRKDEEKIKQEVANLQGTWQAISWVEDGENMPDELLKYVRWTFKGNKLFSTKPFIVIVDGKNRVKRQGGTVETDYEVNPTKKLKVMTGTTVKPRKGIETAGIYSLEGDTLKVCASAEGKDDPPDEFSAKVGTGRTLITFKRKKDAQSEKESGGELKPR